MKRKAPTQDANGLIAYRATKRSRVAKDTAVRTEASILDVLPEIRTKVLYPMLSIQDMGRLAQTCRAFCWDLTEPRKGYMYIPTAWRAKLAKDYPFARTALVHLFYRQLTLNRFYERTPDAGNLITFSLYARVLGGDPTQASPNIDMSMHYVFLLVKTRHTSLCQRRHHLLIDCDPAATVNRTDVDAFTDIVNIEHVMGSPGNFVGAAALRKDDRVRRVCQDIASTRARWNNHFDNKHSSHRYNDSFRFRVDHEMEGHLHTLHQLLPDRVPSIEKLLGRPYDPLRCRDDSDDDDDEDSDDAAEQDQ